MGSPGRAVSIHLARLGSQSEQRIRRMLPARGACHIKKYIYIIWGSQHFGGIGEKFNWKIHEWGDSHAVWFLFTYLLDIDLCVRCYKGKGHEHKMERLGLDFDLEQQQEQDNRKERPQLPKLKSGGCKSSVALKVWYMPLTAQRLNVRFQSVPR